MFVFGTRPEALKLAPLILQARKTLRFKTFVCLTAQHRHMAAQALKLFKIKPDMDLNLMEKGQTLGDLTHRLFNKMRAVFLRIKPDLLIIQGDTTTAFAVALKAFYHRIPVAHVEAGLRTFQKYKPFPEEINRALISRLADFHFAPTPQSARHLLREGIKKDRIFITGNTIVDSVQHILRLNRNQVNGRHLNASREAANTRKLILVTAHRRESFGKPLVSICRALKELLSKHADIEIIFPVHLNPNVQKTVYRELGRIRHIKLVSPLSYEEFLYQMNRSYLILTDSGGVQEEAPALGKPVLVMRHVTERHEGLKQGVAKLVGTKTEAIVAAATRLLTSRKDYLRMIPRSNPYGDGKASARIIRILTKIFSSR